MCMILTSNTTSEPLALMHVRRDTRLPIETIRAIIDEAWKDAATIDERWDLYHSLSTADPALHEIIVSVITRFAIFKFGPSRKDIELCQLVVAQATAFAQARGDSIDASFHKSLFSRSHLTLDFTVLYQIRGSNQRIWLERWDAYITDLSALVPDCRSITAYSLIPLPRDAVPILLRTLSVFPSLAHVYLHADWSHGDVDNCCHTPCIPSVRFFRLKQYPACRCDGARTYRHEPRCLTATLLHAFPNLTHLHLDTAFFLKLLDPPRSLETVTLEAPPMRHIAGREPYSSLIDYNVSAALRRGFLQWKSEGKYVQRKIVVNTGPADPYGFGQALAACREHGVKLVKEVIYMPV